MHTRRFYNPYYIGVIAFVFGILSVWYAEQENILVYPTGLLQQ
jgi:nicotinamide riboside transporter PnuC